MWDVLVKPLVHGIVPCIWVLLIQSLLLRILLPSIKCETNINVFVLFSCFLLLFLFFLNVKFNCKVPILGGNSDDLVSILSRMGTIVLVLLLLLINFYLT